ncbi:hypothetical protein [[Limnothrix rosea] IAM M-220]|uniref:hypothetical protein n=1 Tax=[Limnothrix rosea] IAM M-220 TaxID=454133 RepID=UPI0009657983|nr:hypothetical protein [[Limnothrix rosea] IAM M-220]OKH17421.1 hypothetical protein NIES208_09395 [[Limnothrix rosea] IAM M-220]
MCEVGGEGVSGGRGEWGRGDFVIDYESQLFNYFSQIVFSCLRVSVSPCLHVSVVGDRPSLGYKKGSPF